MAGMLDELQVYLAGAGLGLVFGTNLFAGFQPDTPNAVVVLYEYMPAEPGDFMGPQAPGYENSSLQVKVRDADYVTGRTTARAVYDALRVVTSMTLSGTPYIAIRPQTTPYLLDRDQTRRVNHVFNCRVIKSPS